jgi:predicted ribosomally synthesized peptide with SipW-like signal peptide
VKNLIKKKPYKRIALALSLCALIIWGILGTGASLAWFTDTSDEINNIFHFAEFEVVVSHRLTDGNWEEVDNQTKVFDEEALYEPGYVQVVYLKVENKSKQSIDFSAAVNVNGCDVATNVFGMQFMLHDYLKFGLTMSDSEEEMKNSIPNRSKAEEIADMPLHNYYHDEYESDSARLAPNATKYIALIVRMPKEVDNFANYRNDRIPKVELGITVKAEQVAK